MQVDIRDRVVVITGAAGGLGRALASGLAREGSRIAVLARHEDQAARVVEEITALVPDAPESFGVAVDVGDETQVRAAVGAVDAHWGRVDALINNAGWIPSATRVLDLDVSDLHRVAATYPGGRLGQPEDIVPYAAFPCSDAANHLSGTVLTIRPLTG